jgi:hypothetical protein
MPVSKSLYGVRVLIMLIVSQLVFDKSAATVAAWEDDEDVEVDLHSSSRLRKLKRAHDTEGINESTKVSGKEFTQLLQERLFKHSAKHIRVHQDVKIPDFIIWSLQCGLQILCLETTLSLSGVHQNNQS